MLVGMWMKFAHIPAEKDCWDAGVATPIDMLVPVPSTCVRVRALLPRARVPSVIRFAQVVNHSPNFLSATPLFPILHPPLPSPRTSYERAPFLM